MNRTSIRTVGLALGDATVLVAVHPRWRFVATGLSRPASWLDSAGTDVALAALCAALLWMTALWLGVGLLAGLGTRLPGATGRVCTRVARVALPRILVRVVLGSTGLGLLAAPAAAQAMIAPAPATAHVVMDGVSGSAALSRWTGPGVPTPTWPVTPSSTPVAPPTWPSSGTPRPTTPTHTPRPTTTRPTTTRPTTPTPTPIRTTPATTSAGTARVHRGDSLWLLAARRLGPHADAGTVAHYWPQIYAEDRGVIGDDPSVIHPGQVLHLPASSPESS